MLKEKLSIYEENGLVKLAPGGILARALSYRGPIITASLDSSKLANTY